MRVLRRVPGAEGEFPFDGVAFSPDDRWLALSCGDHTAKLWDLKLGRIARTFGRPVPYSG